MKIGKAESQAEWSCPRAFPQNMRARSNKNGWKNEFEFLKEHARNTRGKKFKENLGLSGREGFRLQLTPQQHRFELPGLLLC